jgi:arsenate reductase
MTITLYGIPNCDTMKKARTWLEAAGVAYAFHDYKRAGAPADRLATWAEEVGWEALLNRAGTTFRGLPEADKADLDAARALALMAAHPSLIRRPVLEGAGALLVGFRPERYAAAFAARK